MPTRATCSHCRRTNNKHDGAGESSGTKTKKGDTSNRFSFRLHETAYFSSVNACWMALNVSTFGSPSSAMIRNRETYGFPGSI